MESDEGIDKSSNELESVENIGFYAGFTLVGFVLFLLPSILRASPGWHTAASVGALFSTGLGLGMAIEELGKLLKRESLRTMSTSVLPLALAGIFFLIAGSLEVQGFLAVLLYGFLYGAAGLLAVVGICFLGGAISVYIAERVTMRGRPPIEPTDVGEPPMTDDTAVSNPPRPQPLRSRDSLTRGERLSIIITFLVGLLTAAATIVTPFLSQR